MIKARSVFYGVLRFYIVPIEVSANTVKAGNPDRRVRSRCPGQRNKTEVQKDLRRDLVFARTRFAYWVFLVWRIGPLQPW